VIGATGCVPFPVKHTEMVSPDVTGIVRDADGTPMSGIPVAVTGSHNDIACTAPSAHGMTDSAGRFHLAVAYKRTHILWLMENFGAIGYWICTGAPATVATQQAAAMTARTNINGWMRGDTLDCVAWTLRELPHVSCNGPLNQHGMFTFGAWRDARDSGTYRLLLADDEKWGFAKRAVVQWVVLSRSDSSAGPRVRATLDLPTGDAVQGASYAVRDGHVIARVESVRPTKGNHRNYLAFELGGPGEAHQVPDK
jgi:hypothetical protein